MSSSELTDFSNNNTKMTEDLDLKDQPIKIIESYVNAIKPRTLVGEIRKLLTSNEITKIDGIYISTLKKPELFSAIKDVYKMKTKPIIPERPMTASRPRTLASMAVRPKPIPSIIDCSLSVAELKNIARKNEWPIPYKNKMQFCEYLKREEFKRDCDIKEKYSKEDKMEFIRRNNILVPEGTPDEMLCYYIRGIPKEEGDIIKLGLKYGFTDYPTGPKATKLVLLKWLNERLESLLCDQNESTWTSEAEIKKDLQCKTGYCHVDKKSCDDESKLSGLTKYDVQLSTGDVSVYGTQSIIDRLKTKIMSILGPKKCGTLKEGTDQEIINDISCKQGEVCNLDTGKCEYDSKENINTGKLVGGEYKGVKIVGSPEVLDEFFKNREPKQPPQPIVEDEQEKPKESVADAIKKVMMDFYKAKAQASASAEPPKPKPPKPEPPKPKPEAKPEPPKPEAKPEPPKPEAEPEPPKPPKPEPEPPKPEHPKPAKKQEVENNLEQIRARLKNLYQLSEDQPSVKVITGLKSVTNQINICVGLSN